MMAAVEAPCESAGLMKLRTLLAALILGFTPIALVAPPPAYAAALGYHIYNVPQSTDALHIYGWANCNPSGPIHILYSGQKATGMGWDSGRVYSANGSRKVVIRIYDDKTGKYLATRIKNAGQCFSISDNTHIIQATL